jgi:hypothetical protein
MRLIPILIGTLVLAMAGLIAVLVLVVLPGTDTPGGVADPGTGTDVVQDFTGGQIDSEARIDIELMRGDMDNLRADIANLRQEIADLNGQIAALSRPAEGPATTGTDITTENAGDLGDTYAQVVNVVDRRNINQGLVVSSPSYLSEKLGLPRPDLNDNCQSMTNPRLADKLVVEQVGPIKVQMLLPAVESMKRVFENIRATDPALYERINTAGSLCVRRIRGTVNSVSTHSFGLAVDLNINGVLDTLGDGKTQVGLNIIYEFFNAEGWVWGAAFSREDSMHFEVSRKQLDQWIAEGKL